ncbi:hypothetical protein SPRG_05849 [Saprolegnia parasitica CBS 223.65]|uniref:Glycosyl transferase family 1 domain-containing protein n=1 Tax=Saprolegnia parasitica (strain CBS 223.65) TaxID=695850 RepID=A0A067CR77_SAPPC|nr:hypothetical protein SPRG_05849 [Saprolegnia parasitica CBS 223.65]KDO29312.1 hypothetical protein SPRG_05849 [Saprolegnia parasitica CBS 223.65]|eukprot:XP_012199819.1 hypothetical protein SPRG_05849 [Saprolegnia parasitica CBS 223.65]
MLQHLLVGLYVALVVAQSENATAVVRFLWPPAGHMEPSSTLRVRFEVPPSDDGYIALSSTKLNGLLQVHPDTIELQGIEPGTHVVVAQVHDKQHTPMGPPSMLRVERVLSKAEADAQRSRSLKPRVWLTALPAVAARRPRRRTLCFVGTNGQFDGQRQLWLHMIRILSRHPSVTYAFHMIRLEAPSTRFDPFATSDVQITYAPMQVSVEEAALYQLTTNTTMEAIADYVEHGTSDVPAHVPRLWATFLRAFAPCEGGILVLANSRDHGDRVLALVAKHVGARGVLFDLSSVFPVANTVDALIGPSTYTLEHESVTSTITARYRHVIPPGIDAHVFTPAATPKTNRCLIVGFLGRLAPEKSLGLLARAAELLAAKRDLCLVFRWIGEGSHAAYYQQYPVELIGGIYNETALVHELQSWDVAVHPGLQETFGIANIEVMAVGIPLVCFGVAGTTEYVRHNENAWVVDEIHADALAAGIEVVARDSGLRHRLGAGARATVEKRFTWSATVAAYDEVFGRLMSAPRDKAATNLHR